MKKVIPVYKKEKPFVKKKGKFSKFIMEYCPTGCGCKLATNLEQNLVWCSGVKCRYYSYLS